MNIVTAAQMKRAEEESARRGISTETLMENAGRAAAIAIGKILGNYTGKHVLLLIGPGNNGNDGLIAARLLHRGGITVDLYVLGHRPEGDPPLLKTIQSGIPVALASEDTDGEKIAELLSRSDAVVDAVLGTGRNRPLEGAFAVALNGLNREKRARPSIQIIAVDVPTGLDADTGAVDPASPVADFTVTLGFPKPGLFSEPGSRWAGRISVLDIGIPPGAAIEKYGDYLELKEIKRLLPLRSPLANKGTFGKVLIVAGSVNYVGAAGLAAGAAMRTGAGLTTLATAGSLLPVMASRPLETTYLPLIEVAKGFISPQAVASIMDELKSYDALLVGPGMGQADHTLQFLQYLFSSLKTTPAKIVLDADALNALARTPDWWQTLNYDAILTPHPGEMARLTGQSVSAIQRDRLSITRAMAQQWGKTIVLKGAYTVIAAPDGKLAVSPFANAGLATAGTGDVLAGIITGLVAQGLSLFDAACLGVYLHGMAGEMVGEILGDTGMLASDLLMAIPRTVKKIKEVN